MSVLLIPNPTKDTGLAVTRQAAAVLAGLGVPVLMPQPFANEFGSAGLTGVHFLPEADAYRAADQVVTIGGDGTLRCAHDIALEVERRGLNISVIGIPKTIDNDINYIDKTFGFETAVYATGPVISAAHNEAKGAPNGIGLIHVMGRDSGFIAAYATLANTHVNYCLIPEDPFSLYDGEHALLPSLERRLKLRKHAVIIVSEGAGQHLFKEDSEKRDKSGNKLHHNIGEFLRDTITSWGKESNIDLTVKYFDPSYLIRSLPSNGTDSVFCEMLAQHAVHCAMAGCTDVVIGHWNDRFTYVPIPVATSSRKKVDIESGLWDSEKSATWKY